jgi:hypothetical protein
MAGRIHVELIRAWPRRHASRTLALDAGATAADALTAAGWDMEDCVGLAVFGERVAADQVLVDGDRLELLRPLTIDPKDARRRRAGR